MQKWLEQLRNQFAARPVQPIGLPCTARLHRPPPTDTGASATGDGLTREHVLWAYQLLLGRELDDEQVIQE